MLYVMQKESSKVTVVFFAYANPLGWEAIIRAILGAGLIVTSSWPIATERTARTRAIKSSSLQSSIHIICRPRVRKNDVGEWHEVLSELEPKVHSWMQRLVRDGIVGADAIFACVGPALEIFSRYERVETASGKAIELPEYLRHVWSAVAKAALNMIFESSDPSSFEEDGRLTAIWLWTLRTDINGSHIYKPELEDGNNSKKNDKYKLDYDAALKISQGLGIHLDNLVKSLVIETDGKAARLVPVSQRKRYLLGNYLTIGRKKKNALFMKDVTSASKKRLEKGKTILDRVHQSMLLFADSQTERLKNFLAIEGVGDDNKFWNLSQALSALYPRNSAEKSLIDGVLSRKKSFGF
jgi:putative DNA methylase